MSWTLLTLLVLALGLLGGLRLRADHRRLSRCILTFTALLLAVVTAGTASCWDAPEGEGTADYGLLLGCALEDGRPTGQLERRCTAALEWMQENPGLLLVVSGGDPGGQGVTEASVMADWLVAHGADPARLVPEARSNDTRENLLYSRRLIRGLQQQTDTVAIITSEYHQTRAAFLARHNGQNALSISSPTPMPEHLFAAVREVYAFCSEILELLS